MNVIELEDGKNTLKYTNFFVKFSIYFVTTKKTIKSIVIRSNKKGKLNVSWKSKLR